MSLYIQPYLEPADPSKPDHDPIGEEMLQAGLDPQEVSEKAYLSARLMVLAGRADDVAELARRIERARAREDSESFRISLQPPSHPYTDSA